MTTIDHLMGAVETKRGGKYILPSLRLMSSDLVIDEIDDFNREDLTAIARLIHLAGMYGRNVVISSATIPPDLAEGMYRSYLTGLSCRNAFFTDKKYAPWFGVMNLRQRCRPGELPMTGLPKPMIVSFMPE